MKEIEYKFLVDHDKWSKLEKPEPTLIVQGYISISEEVVVRVRIKGDKGFLTIKGKMVGITRPEFEYEIPLEDAEAMVELFTEKHIRKYRYEVMFDGKIWEIDEFHGKLQGLVVAELEVQSENELFSKPSWVTADVSTDPKYFNAVLIDQC
jgi:adenylate cyclase